MTDILYYNTAVEDGKVIVQKITFTPKGMCKFKANLGYQFMGVTHQVSFDTDHKVTSTKFQKFTQPYLNKIEKEFYWYVDYLRLSALLSGDVSHYTKLLKAPVTGQYEGYITT